MGLYNIARINNTLDLTHKYLCVFGCLLTQDGIAIKEEMLAWLERYYHVFCVDQRPPGALFEYPAIFYAAQLSIDTQNPVLYIHTKGAANRNHLQSKVRNMWKREFSPPQLYKYLDAVNSKRPTVATPFASPEGSTWFNGYILNPSAADIVMHVIDDMTHPIQMHLKPDKIRYRYEHLFRSTVCNVVGILQTSSSDKIWGHSCWTDA